MATNWKREVSKINSETFVLPEGWTSREDVAKDLDCSEDKVDDNLRAGLKSGRFIKQSHKVWNDALGRCVMVIAYHDTALDLKPVAVEVEIEKLKALKAEGKSYAEIGLQFGLSGGAVKGRLQRAG